MNGMNHRRSRERRTTDLLTDGNGNSMALTTAVIPGVGPDAPKTENEYGGRQSQSPYRFDLIDPAALFAMAEILAKGAQDYGEDNWRAISAVENVNHAIQHLYAYLAGDTQEGDPEQHLRRAFCRVHFALGVKLQGGPIRAEVAQEHARQRSK